MSLYMYLCNPLVHVFVYVLVQSASSCLYTKVLTHLYIMRRIRFSRYMCDGVRFVLVICLSAIDSIYKHYLSTNDCQVWIHQKSMTFELKPMGKWFTKFVSANTNTSHLFQNRVYITSSTGSIILASCDIIFIYIDGEAELLLWSSLYLSPSLNTIT